MPTTAQSAIADGLAALQDVHGQPWTFGRAVGFGVASVLEPTDPRLKGSPDRLFQVTFPLSTFSTLPKRGDELVHQGNFHRVSHAAADYVAGVLTLLVAPA